MDRSDSYWIEYRFELFETTQTKDFLVLLDRETLVARSPGDSRETEWTRLGFHRCDICPLDPAKVRNCPIAYNISGLAKEFSEIYSTEETLITVNVEERSYSRKDSVQQGLRSVLGIYMATSGCPHMDILKPMARFHLPFASMEETLYRHISNYLLAQFFEFQDSGGFDLALDEYATKNEAIHRVNTGICDRIMSMAEADANRNALISLYSIGLMVNLEIQAKFDSLRHFFRRR